MRDKQILHRLQHVLHLDIDDECVFFGTRQHVRVRMVQQSKGLAVFRVLSVAVNSQLRPCVTLVLPLLKKMAFEEAVYSAAEMGANAIQLVVTNKSRQDGFGQRDAERLQRIMVAAAEQSKQYALPEVMPPLPLEHVLSQVTAKYIFFCDPAGSSFVTLIEQAAVAPDAKIAVMIGPEGDLTEEEKKLCKKNGWVFASLTPTVLRAQQAVAVALGILRSALR